ncbi:MAG: DUF3987 domain-containing protein, partial [Desulfovibrionaceae bacterium]|nr:DUF3987 domain-containing protein [Desulfovibrionaceae bacterium]
MQEWNNDYNELRAEEQNSVEKQDSQTGLQAAPAREGADSPMPVGVTEDRLSQGELMHEKSEEIRAAQEQMGEQAPRTDIQAAPAGEEADHPMPDGTAEARLPQEDLAQEKAGEEILADYQKQVEEQDPQAGFQNAPAGEEADSLMPAGADGAGCGADEAHVPAPAGRRAAAGTRSDILPAPPVPPLWVFPEPIQRLLREAAEAYVVPIQIPVAALLSLLSTLVGRTRGIAAKDDWVEHGNLWIVTLAPSGLGKSPLLKAFFREVRALERTYKAEYEQESKKYEAECSRCKKKGIECAMPRPKKKQFYLNDTTKEAIGTALDANPRGVTLIEDEISGYLASLDKYSGGKDGGDKQQLNNTHDCNEWKTTRRDESKNFHIPSACLSITGGLQPELMSHVFSTWDLEIGFMQRFIFIRAERERPALWTDTTVSAASKNLLKTIVQRLEKFELQDLGEGETAPFIVKLSPEAREVYKAWHDREAIASFERLSEGQPESSTQKLKVHVLRVCLLLHCLDAALANSDGLSPVS